MRLLLLELENFKGIRRYSFAPNGHDVNVCADNAVGKTTLADAFYWLLFDKDSANRKDFEVKTLNANGEAIPGLEHGVAMTLELPSGGKCKLRKVYKEVWTQKRGSAHKQFSGHTTDYYIDGVPVNKTEYTQRVAAIADENILRLLTDPMHFNVNLHWQDRRRILLEVCGDVTFEEVIAADSQLKSLPTILENRTLEKHRDMILARRKEINKELERIPVRMDEARKGMPELPEGKDRATLEADINALRARRQAKESEKTRIEAGGEMAEKRRRLAEIEAEMLEIASDLRAQNRTEIDRKQTELNGLRKRMDALRLEADRLNGEADAARERAIVLEHQMEELRSEWHRVNDEPFVHEHDETCPTCGQAIPPEQIEEARAKALADFNEKKAKRLTKINEDGAKLKEQKLLVEQQINEKLGKVIALGNEIDELESRSSSLLSELEELEASVSSVEDDPDYRKLSEEKAEVEAAIRELQSNAADAIKAITDEIQAIDNQLYFLGIDLACFTQRDKAEERLRELDAEQRKLAYEYERIEKEVYLLERFIQVKVRLLEERINTRFQIARFKLFDMQVNGGIAECCETTVDGVPFSDLNHGAQLNVGLDIINTLAGHYGIAPPVWIDNAESVTNILPTKGQQIRLVVSESDKALRVELRPRAEVVSHV